MRLVERFEASVRDHALKGSKRPEDAQAIEEEYRESKRKLEDYIRLWRRKAIDETC